MPSPTSRSMAVCRDRNWQPEIVEHWQPWAKVRKDLFGLGDILALNGQQTILIQCTSGANHAARVKKLEQHENTPHWLKSSTRRLLVWSWRKNAKGRWVMRETEINLKGDMT